MNTSKALNEILQAVNQCTAETTKYSGPQTTDEEVSDYPEISVATAASTTAAPTSTTGECLSGNLFTRSHLQSA